MAQFAEEAADYDAVVLMATQGGAGHDGSIQNLLDMHGVTYTGDFITFFITRWQIHVWITTSELHPEMAAMGNAVES
jgi:hypothetical protein